MKNITYLIFGLIILCASCQPDEIEEVSPNIVLFLVDDMGWQDTSVPFWIERTPFNDLYQTPNMERLAKGGMKFTQAYANPVGSPTRISLMTGMNAARHRVTNRIFKKNDSIQIIEKNNDSLLFPKWNVNGMSAIEGDPKAVYAMPLAQALHDVGYFTIHAGKANFGAIGTPGENPLNLGFDINIAGQAAGSPGSYLGTENFGNGIKDQDILAVPGLEKYHGKDIYLTEAITQEALIAIDSAVAGQQPFFLNISHYAIHSPITEDKRYFEKYLAKGMDSTEAKYASMIEGIDKSLGDILNYTEKKNIANNTIILFMSDNGGLSANARGGLEPNSHNAPLSSGKGSMHEGGIREPMLVKWPEKVKPESVSTHQVIIEDFYPTILEMAGIDSLKTVQKVDGQSFASVLKGEIYDGIRPLVWHFPNEWGNSGPGIGAASTIRKGDWKLIYYHVDRSMVLFNLKDDIGETKNLASDNPKTVMDLAISLTNYLKGVNAQMPIDKNTGELVPFPLAVLKPVKEE